MLRWLAVVIAMLPLSLTAWAGDVVTLRDGRRVTGVVQRHSDGNVWIQPGGGQEAVFFGADEVQGVELGPDSKLLSVKLPEPAPGAPKAAVITLGGDEGGMVGLYITAGMIKEVATRLTSELGDDKRGVVILRLKSNGGFTEDGIAIAEAIQAELKPHWRTVCWVDVALSSSVVAMSSVEEVVPTSGVTFGGDPLMGFGPRRQPIAKERLEDFDRISRMGGHDPMMLRSMYLELPLSVSIHLAQGNVKSRFTYFADVTSGELVIKRQGEVLLLNPEMGQAIGFFSGKADTLDELTKVLGYEALDWVGDRAAATHERPWPVSRAEAWNHAQRADLARSEESFSRAMSDYKTAVASATAMAQGDDRDGVVGVAEVQLKKMRALLAKYPSIAKVMCGEVEVDEFFKGLEESVAGLKDR